MRPIPALVCAALLASSAAFAIPPNTGSTTGSPTGSMTDNPAGAPGNTGTEDLERVKRISELIYADDWRKKGDGYQYFQMVVGEINRLSEESWRVQLMTKLREAFDRPPAGGTGGTGQQLKPGDPGWSEDMAWRIRTTLLPQWKENSADPKVWSENGQLWCQQQDYRRCISDLDKAIELGARDPETYSTYASAAHNLGDYKLAVKSAQLALEGDPRNQLADAVLKLSEGRVPVVELPSALKGGGDFAPQANSAVVDGLPGGGGGPAQAASGPAPAGGPPGVARPDAPVQITQGQVDRSAQFTKEAAASLAVRDYPGAHQAASRAIQLNIQNAQAWNFRAIANNKLDRFRDAAYDASYALNLAPGNTAALQSRAWALNKTGKYKEALADANFTLEREPDNAFAYQNRAFALAGMGDRAGMIDSLKRSADLDARFKGRYDAALQIPQSADVLYLFDEDTGAKAPPSSPERRNKRFVTLVAVVVSGGFLMALGFLHIVSASWRERVRGTIRKLIGAAPAEEQGPGAQEPAMAGTTGFWGQYRVVQEVGVGGMGVVYEGLDTALDRRVAIKKMRDEIRLDRRERDRFLQEARTVASLRHPNIVEIFSIVEDGGEVYLVFEFATGKTLAAMMEEAGSLPFETARRILKDACGAVDYAHRHKVIHRDLKPSNIMVTEEGTAKVMDFGVARQAKDAASKVMTNTVVGTPPYMAPEQEQGSARIESDVYALGVMFYEMLCGELPFAGHGAGMLLNKLNGKYEPLSTVSRQALPAGIDDVMARVLLPDPVRRYRSAGEFLAAVQALS